MNEPSKLQVWFRLFWIFLKVNLLTTAGPTSIGLLYKETVGKIMTEAQFVEAVGFSNLVPGSEALKHGRYHSSDGHHANRGVHFGSL
jgi:chromate transport protein ChrA